MIGGVDFLSRLVAKLEESHVPYMLTGSVASSYHGIPRTTQDVDFVIDPKPAALGVFVQALPVEEYYVDSSSAFEALARRSQFNVIDQATGWKADLIVIKNRPFSRAEFDRRCLGSVMGVQAFVSSREDSILSKLEWSAKSGSERQLRDVAGVLSVGAEIDLQYIQEWVKALDLKLQWDQARGLGSAPE
ncbi:MAG: hypothetical protein ACI87O_001795 [Planctomycetota bacterium]|jgi:hypothetical protein